MRVHHPEGEHIAHGHNEEEEAWGKTEPPGAEDANKHTHLLARTMISVRMGALRISTPA